MDHKRVSLPPPYETESFSLRFEQEDKAPFALVLRLKGSVGNEEAKIIQDRTMGLLSSERNDPVIIDFSMVGYVSSSGIGTFLELLQKTEQKGVPMRLSGVIPRIRSLFSALGLETYFSFTDSV